MSVDLSDIVTAIDYDDPNEWSSERLDTWLREHDLPATCKDGKNHFKLCPLCNESEGNAACWIRDGQPVFKCFRQKCGGSFADLVARVTPTRLATTSLESLPAKFPKPRGIVVEGLIRRGDVVNLVGGPKARKSFLVMQLALCVASGIPFLGRATTQGRVLLIDNELRGDDLARRAQAMASAMGLDWHTTANIETMLLRGQLADLNTIKAAVAKVPAGTFSLIVVDALYKTLPKGTDENSNSDITAAYITLDGIAEGQDCASVVVHHTSKGTQHAKAVSDMGAGAGAQSRSADVHLVLRDHEDADTVVLAAVVRSQRPVDPICIQFMHPLWRVAPDKNPGSIAVAGKKPSATLADFLETIPVAPSPKKETLAATKLALGISRDSLDALTHEATKRGLIEIVVPSNRTSPHLISRSTKA